MKICQYNLIIFINNSYDDHIKIENPNWQNWFKSINKMFNNNIPKKILLMLQRKNNIELNNLCKEQMQINEIKKVRYYEKLKNENEKYQKYIQKRDNGNKKAIEMFKIQKNDEKLKNDILDQQINQLYVDEMLPVWKSRIDKLINERNDFISSIKI
jgi:hypothetical protein